MLIQINNTVDLKKKLTFRLRTYDRTTVKKYAYSTKCIQSYYGTKVRMPVAIQFYETMFNIDCKNLYVYLTINFVVCIL